MMGLIPGILTALGLNKTLAYVIEIAVVAIIVAAAGAWIMHEHDKAKAYDVLHAEHVSLEQKYGCDKRPSIAERELATCLVARQADADHAVAAEIERQRNEAAKMQALVDRAEAEAAKSKAADDVFIDEEAASGDGAVPKVLLDSWARERAARGVK